MDVSIGSREVVHKPLTAGIGCDGVPIPEVGDIVPMAAGGNIKNRPVPGYLRRRGIVDRDSIDILIRRGGVGFHHLRGIDYKRIAGQDGIRSGFLQSQSAGGLIICHNV